MSFLVSVINYKTVMKCGLKVARGQRSARVLMKVVTCQKVRSTPPHQMHFYTTMPTTTTTSTTTATTTQVFVNTGIPERKTPGSNFYLHANFIPVPKPFLTRKKNKREKFHKTFFLFKKTATTRTTLQFVFLYCI